MIAWKQPRCRQTSPVNCFVLSDPAQDAASAQPSAALRVHQLRTEPASQASGAQEASWQLSDSAKDAACSQPSAALRVHKPRRQPASQASLLAKTGMPYSLSAQTDAPCARHRAHRRRAGRLRGSAVKEDCRDKVNSPSHTSVSQRTVKVTFQGAGGQAVQIDCPEVRVMRLWHASSAAGCPDPLPVQDMYILEAGLEAGLELPYTCRGGICGCEEYPGVSGCCLAVLRPVRTAGPVWARLCVAAWTRAT